MTLNCVGSLTNEIFFFCTKCILHNLRLTEYVDAEPQMPRADCNSDFHCMENGGVGLHVVQK